MRIKICASCRGDGKIFTLFEVGNLPPNHTLKACYPLVDGVEVPFLLDEKKKSDAGRGDARYFVGTFPNLTIRECTFDLCETDASGVQLDVYRYRLDFEGAKWRSRLNYRTRPNVCSSIRNFDDVSRYDRAGMEFWQCVENASRDSYILRALVRTPYREDTTIALTCINEHGAVIDLHAISCGVQKVASSFSREVMMREEQFSLRLPRETCRYFFDIRDANHPELSGMGALNDLLLNDLLISSRAEILQNAQSDSNYQRWFDERVVKGKIGAAALKKQTEVEFSYEPVFSIVVPLYRTPESFFRDMVCSVRAQTYGKWELILVNASPDMPELEQACACSSSEDGRIKVVPLEGNFGICLNTNAGIAAATGDFVCFLDHDDTLEPDALFRYVEALNGHGDIDLLYSDEDKIMSDGTYTSPFFKPDFNIDLLRSVNYIIHFLCIRKDLLDTLAPNTSEFDGAGDYNLILEAEEKARVVWHEPRVLYHWRIHGGSTSGSTTAKPYAKKAGLKAVQAHLDRLGLSAEVYSTSFGYRVIYDVPSIRPLVSIIIPTKDHIDLLDACISSIMSKSTYDNYEIVVIENNSTDPATFEFYGELEDRYPGVVRVVYWPEEFNFSKLMNFGAEHARGEYLLLLNNDTEVITPAWIDIMLGLCARGDVGAVGVRLIYPDGTIQHAGVCEIKLGPSHFGLFQPRDFPGYFAMNTFQRDVSAVTGACLMTSRAAFESVDGFTEELAVAYNDVDFCFKLREHGLLVVYTPEVELYHHESISRGTDSKLRQTAEISYIKHRWTSYFVDGDPYFNPNFDQNDPYFHLNWS